MGAAIENVEVAETAPFGVVTHEDGWAAIGAIVLGISGQVVKMPCRNLTPPQRARLDAVADQVWIQGLEALEGWRFNWRFGGWIAGVRMR